MSEYIRAELDRDAGVLVLTIDRPARLNAFDSAMVSELSLAVEVAERDSAVRAIVLTGAGDRAFIAGGDVEEMRGLTVAGAEPFVYAGQALTLRIERCAVP